MNNVKFIFFFDSNCSNSTQKTVYKSLAATYEADVAMNSLTKGCGLLY